MRKLVLGLCLSSPLRAGGAPARGREQPALSDETRQFVGVPAKLIDSGRPPKKMRPGGRTRVYSEYGLSARRAAVGC